MKPLEKIELEKIIARKRLAEYFNEIQSILDTYENETGDYIKEVTFSRVDVAGMDAECQRFEIGRVDLIFY